LHQLRVNGVCSLPHLKKMVRRYAHLAAEHLARYVVTAASYGTNPLEPADVYGTAKINSLEDQP
jgi:hypothetical protein